MLRATVGVQTKPDATGAEVFYKRYAAELGLPFSLLGDARLDRAIPPESYRAVAAKATAVRIETPAGRRVAIAPGPRDLPRIRTMLAGWTDGLPPLIITTPAAIRQLIVDDPYAELMVGALDRLRTALPHFSASRAVTRSQARVLFVMLAVTGCLAWLAPQTVLIALLALVGGLFLAGSWLRGLVLTGLVAPRRVSAPGSELQDLPIYTILVPLYREARIVPQLIAGLDQLDYPTNRLDIKLLLEADDRETCQALANHALGSAYDVIVLPSHLPRTKPSALSVGLALARGEFVTVFDAEDRPEPGQLREALAAFATEPDLGVAQARLAYANWRHCWLTRQFAIEYATLFDVMLPAFERLDIPILLGGTSNHFRTETLRKVGGWDPYNVTEDADLGIRLARCGFRTRILSSTTYEEAPQRLSPWISQRSRWIKGWLQTLLVHLRDPWALCRDLGPRRAIALMVILLTGVAAPILAPVALIGLTWQVMFGNAFTVNGDVTDALLGLWIANLGLGYTIALLVAAAGCMARKTPGLIVSLWTTPVYWALTVFGASRALTGLITNPFHWAKTEHGLASDCGSDLPVLSPDLPQAPSITWRSMAADSSGARSWTKGEMNVPSASSM
ncbi:MAG: glycosyltransferase family 2 protein [Pseudomonadota bacterium]